MTLGQKLKEIRNRFGLSQEELANIMNVFRQAITKQENDNRIPDISNLQELSKIFGIAVDYLLGNESIPVSTADSLGDLSLHYLVIKNNIKLLVNIKNMFQEENNYTLKNGFRNNRKIKFSKNIEK